MSDDRRGSKGARKRRRLSKSTPAKKGCPFSSWAPLRPRRFSLLQTRLCRVLDGGEGTQVGTYGVQGGERTRMRLWGNWSTHPHVCKCVWV